MACLKAFFFGSPPALLGHLHVPKSLNVPRAAVVLCNPFGEEALRAHRLYRVLARKLADEGYPALRFDYSCSGDSHGDSADATIEGWISDVERAAAELRQVTKARRVLLAGLRLGGSIAMLAAKAADAHHVVLCDPVVTGVSYLRELAQQHADYMFAETGQRRYLEQQEPSRLEQALGHPVGPRLREELAALDLSRAETLRLGTGATVVSTTAAGASLQARYNKLGGVVPQWIDAGGAESWNSDAALNRAVVPMNLVREVVNTVRRVTPV